MYCQNCGNKINDNEDICLNCGVMVRKNNSYIDEDKPNIGLNILSFLIPLVGLILFVVFNNESPVKAKSCGKFALIGFCIPFVFLIISFIISLLTYTYITST
jgi:hypothetical protein